jgi:hypothetical protein
MKKPYKIAIQMSEYNRLLKLEGYSHNYEDSWLFDETYGMQYTKSFNSRIQKYKVLAYFNIVDENKFMLLLVKHGLKYYQAKKAILDEVLERRFELGV